MALILLHIFLSCTYLSESICFFPWLEVRKLFLFFIFILKCMKRHSETFCSIFLGVVNQKVSVLDVHLCVIYLKKLLYLIRGMMVLNVFCRLKVELLNCCFSQYTAKTNEIIQCFSTAQNLTVDQTAFFNYWHLKGCMKNEQQLTWSCVTWKKGVRLIVI